MDKIGGNTSRTSGQVTATSTSFFSSGNNQLFYNQVEVSNIQYLGDSGGPAYHVINLPINQVRPNVLIGIATFGNVPPLYRGFVSKVTNILPTLGIVLHSSNRPSHGFILKQAVPYGSGSITNPNNVLGLRDNQFANIKGTAANAGGQIVTIMDRPMTGDIWIYARSEPGYNTDLYTYVSFDFNTWTQTMIQTVSSSGGAQWVYCGTYTKSDFIYVGLAAINDNNNAANISIDMAIVVPK